MAECPCSTQSVKNLSFSIRNLISLDLTDNVTMLPSPKAVLGRFRAANEMFFSLFRITNRPVPFMLVAVPFWLSWQANLQFKKTAELNYN